MAVLAVFESRASLRVQTGECSARQDHRVTCVTEDPIVGASVHPAGETLDFVIAHLRRAPRPHRNRSSQPEWSLELLRRALLDKWRDRRPVLFPRRSGASRIICTDWVKWCSTDQMDSKPNRWPDRRVLTRVYKLTDRTAMDRYTEISMLRLCTFAFPSKKQVCFRRLNLLCCLCRLQGGKNWLGR